MRIWTYKNADEKAHTFSRRSKNVKKRTKTCEKRILRKFTLRKQNIGLGKLSISKKKNKSKSNLSKSSTITSMLQIAMYEYFTMMQCVHCLRSINNQSTAIWRQILPVDIEVEYFCDNIIYHHPTSVRIFL